MCFLLAAVSQELHTAPSAAQATDRAPDMPIHDRFPWHNRSGLQDAHEIVERESASVSSRA